jgi:hypothetical protein
MPSKEEIFKERLAVVMLDANGPPPDAQTAALLGSLADRIVSAAGKPTWAAFKATLSVEDFRGLLATFQNQGNALAKQGALAQLHAIEILACSLIAKTQAADPAVAKDDKTLNHYIDRAIRKHRGTSTPDPVIG